jgi:hypothetical protein
MSSIGEIAEAVTNCIPVAGFADRDIDQASPLAARSIVAATATLNFPLNLPASGMTDPPLGDVGDLRSRVAAIGLEPRKDIGKGVNFDGNDRRELRKDQNQKGYRGQRRIHDASPHRVAAPAPCRTDAGAEGTGRRTRKFPNPAIFLFLLLGNKIVKIESIRESNGAGRGGQSKICQYRRAVSGRRFRTGTLALR